MKVLNRIKLNIYYLVCKFEFILKMPCYKYNFIIYVIKILLGLVYNFLELSWHTVASLNLLLRLDKGFDFLINIEYVYYQHLNKKKFNTFWNLSIKEKYYFCEAKKMIQISEDFILKKSKLRIPMVLKKKFSSKQFQPKYYKKTKKLKLLYLLYKKKVNMFSSFKHIFITSLNIIWYEMWYNLILFKAEHFPWWRYFNIREVELEHYDQIMSLIFSSTAMCL
nr:hypothetical protein CcurKRNrm2_p067 [Cryptomonas curvata]